MKMRQRKRELYARMYIGLQISALLAELEEAAETLRIALEEGEVGEGQNKE